MPAARDTAIPTLECAPTRLRRSGLPPDVASSAAHEFNNVFTAILLRISAAGLVPHLPAEAREQLLRAESEISWGREVVRMILAIDAKDTPGGSSIPAARLVDFIRGAGVFRTVPSLPPEAEAISISGDGTALAQAFRFLALRLTRGGAAQMLEASIREVRADIRVPLSPAGKRYLQISLGPSGGNDSRILREEFLEQPGTGDGEGFDLAIAAADAILRRNGGRLAITGDGTGITGFSVYLPVAEESGDTSGTRGTKGKVLLMDDEESIRDIAAILFARNGYRITTVADGAEAVREYRTAMESGAPYDAVIMDLTVPLGMGGREAIRLIRDMDPEARAIVSSGHHTDPAMVDCHAYGFSDAVEKPYRIETLLGAVENLLRTPGMLTVLRH